METIPTPQSRPDQETVRDRVVRYFSKTNTETHSFIFDAYEKAKAKVDEINAEYEGIAFVAEDNGRFVVKFRAEHIGEGFEEYHPKTADVEETA